MLRLFIYTLVGSLLMLAAAIAFAVMAAGAEPVSFVFSDLAARRRPLGGLAELDLPVLRRGVPGQDAGVPVPRLDARRLPSMPLPVLAVFSGVLSKVAAYGFLKIVPAAFPDATAHFQMLLLLIALASILYGSAMAFTTTNARLMLGYSSIAQLGFIVLGIFSLGRGRPGRAAAVGQPRPRRHRRRSSSSRCWPRAPGSEDLRDMGGGAFRAPVLAALFLIVALATLAMPGSSNFAGEFLILLGVFKAKMVIAIIAFTGVALASVYMLRMFIRTMHNRVGATMESREITFARRAGARAAGARDPRAGGLPAGRARQGRARRRSSSIAAASAVPTGRRRSVSRSPRSRRPTSTGRRCRR